MLTIKQNIKNISPINRAILITLIFGAFQLPFSSFMADDFMQLGILEGVSPHSWLGPMGIYTLADGRPEHMRISKDRGAFQWFRDPEFKAKFFRPFSAALLMLDHWIFGLNPIGYSIHSILWFLSLVIAAGFLMQRIVPGRTGTLALFIFTISGIHWYVVYWAAARHIITAAALGLWSLLAYIKWREQGWKKGRILSFLGFSLSLLAGEAALGILAYLCAYEFFAAKTGRQKDTPGVLKRLLPYIILTIGYFIFYKSCGYGAYGGSGYINPLTEPLQFLLAFPGRVLALAGSMILGGHTELWMISSIRPFMIFACVLAVVLITVLLKKTRPLASSKEIKSTRWLLSGSILSMVPFCAASPGARSLVIPFIGGSVILSLIFRYRSSLRCERKVFGIFCWVLLFIHFVFAPFQRFAGPVFAKSAFVNRLESILKKAEFDHVQPPQKLVFLTVPDFAVGLHSYYYRKLYRQPMPESWWVLSWEKCDHRLYRSSERVFELELIEGSIKQPFLREGAFIKLTGMDVKILETDDKGAKRIEFKFDRSLDDPSLGFLAWIDGRLRRIKLPPVGSMLLQPYMQNQQDFISAPLK